MSFSSLVCAVPPHAVFPLTPHIKEKESMRSVPAVFGLPLSDCVRDGEPMEDAGFREKGVTVVWGTHGK